MAKSKDPNTPSAFYWNDQEVASWIGGIGYPQYKARISTSRFFVAFSSKTGFMAGHQTVIGPYLRTRAKSMTANFYQKLYQWKKARST